MSAGCSFGGQDWQKTAGRRLTVVFSKGSGSGVPVQVWACASMSDNEGGIETKEGKVLSCFGKLYWKENMLSTWLLLFFSRKFRAERNIPVFPYLDFFESIKVYKFVNFLL